MRLLFIILFGFSAGIITAAGVYALISSLNLLPRYATVTKTTKYIKLYEWMLILGGILGNIAWFWPGSLEIPVWCQILLEIIIGLCFGIFIGSLVMSLAEMLDGTTIYMRRLRLVRGTFFLVLAIALGKAIGAFWQLFYSSL